uniref:Sulfide:quinone oxidoreductase, mitochondrial n=1 Tax=Ixodes ricinus TaxID=34613 RepID=V5HCB1_IXORI
MHTATSALWTLVGGGLKPASASIRPMKEVMPSNALWIRDQAEMFVPQENVVVTKGGLKIKYDFLVVAVGIQVRFDMIKGLEDALRTPNVCSNYSYKTVTKTFSAMQNFDEGTAIFTYPATPAKCPGAAQKVMYLTDAYLRKVGKRDKAKIVFNSSLGVLFGAPKYADALWGVVKDRDITVNLKHELVEVRPQSKEAVFCLLDSPATPKGTVTYKYEMLHVTPPMAAPAVLKTGASFVGMQLGFLGRFNPTDTRSTRPTPMFSGLGTAPMFQPPRLLLPLLEKVVSSVKTWRMS